MKTRSFIFIISVTILVLVTLLMIQHGFRQTPVKKTSDWVKPSSTSATQELFPGATGTSATRTATPQAAATPNQIIAPTNPATTPTIYLIQLANKPDKAQQAQFMATLAKMLGRPVEVVYQYDTVYHGLAVKLTPAEAIRVSKMAGVRRVQPDTLHYPQEGDLR